MRVLFYWRPETSEEKRFQQIVESPVIDVEKEIFQSIEDLTVRLRQPLYDEIIAVFMITDQNDLSDILPIHHLLRCIRLILVLPDHEETTISKGLELYPRFISYIDSDFSDVTAVLEKMINGSSNMKTKERRVRKKFKKVLRKLLRVKFKHEKEV